MDAAPLSADRRAELDRDVAALDAMGWAALTTHRRIEHLRTLLDGVRTVAAEQVAAACAAKGISPGTPAEGEEWLSAIVPQFRTLRRLLTTLESVAATGTVEIPDERISELPDGRLAVRMLPDSAYDRVLYRGFRADVRTRAGVTRDNLHEHVGGVATRPAAPATALVLGAGNVAAIAPLDVVHKLFVEGRAVLLKLNPVNEYLEPFLRTAFGALIDAGFVRIVRGDAAVGAYLCGHAGIDEIHVTGSRATHDAIVWGVGDAARERRAQGTPLTTKRVTSELGNVGPVIIVPGHWSPADIRFHAENVATQMTQNGGFNCNAAKVLVTSAAWPQRDEFLDALRTVLRGLPPRRAYYPGAAERWERFVGAHDGAEVLGERDETAPGNQPASGDVLPPALLIGQDPGQRDLLCFREESFCAVLAETALPGSGAGTGTGTGTGTGAFLEQAVAFANDSLEGTLNACVIVDPATRRRLGPAFDRAIDALRYGTVAINHWPAIGFALGGTTWGAYPGHTLADVGSGIGWVHGAWLLNRPEKSVIDGPFRVWPKPAWFVTHPRADRIARRLADFEGRPSLLGLLRVLAWALLPTK